MHAILVSLARILLKSSSHRAHQRACGSRGICEPWGTSLGKEGEGSISCGAYAVVFR
jgi:hypothetical protein